MQFTVDDNLYGINVAKVREIMMSVPVKAMPHAHPAVEGIFKPRDVVLTVVDLPFYLTGQHSKPNPKDLFIVTNFNKMYIAFACIQWWGSAAFRGQIFRSRTKRFPAARKAWPQALPSAKGQLVTVLDFERIVAEIAPETTIQISEIEKKGARAQRSCPVLVAEDSILLSRMIQDSLEKGRIYKPAHVRKWAGAVGLYRTAGRGASELGKACCTGYHRY